MWLLLFVSKIYINFANVLAYAVPSCYWMRGGVGALHNLKASSMLVNRLMEPRKFHLQVYDNVRSECYGYAIIVSRSVLRGYIVSSRTLFRRYVLNTGVGRHSTSSTCMVFLGPHQRTSRDGSLRFFVMWLYIILLKFNFGLELSLLKLQ